MLRNFLLLIFSSVLTCHVFAGVVKGHVSAHENGELLTGAVIQAEGTPYKTMTGLDGSFSLKNIPAGTYNIVISMVGYATITEKIEVGNDTKTIDIQLNTSHTSLESVVVTGKKGTSEIVARNMERNANQVMNVVSAKAIEISPDMIVANVVQRVSGVSIERNSNGDGQYAILRGMDKRYNYTLVNGIKIPSPDNKYRYVPLDIFPSDMLDRLEVYKSLTPSMEGDAIGGAVNLVMKDAPAHRLFTINIAGSYSELFMDRDFMSYKGRDVNNQSPYELHGSDYKATPQDFSTVTSTYTNKTPLPGIIGGFTYGDRFLKNKLGFIVATSLQNTYRGSNSLLYSSENVDTLKGVTLTSMSERQYSEQQFRYGIHTKIDYQFNKKNSISMYNAFMNLTNTQIRDAISTDFSIGGYDPVQGNASLDYDTRSRRTIQHIWNSTLHGDHQLTDRLSIDWSAVYSKASNQEPDNTTVSLYGVERNFVKTRTTVDNSSRRWMHNTDQDYAGYLNVTWLQHIGNTKVEWKLGGLYRDKERVNFYNNYSLTPVDRLAIYGKDFVDYNQIAWTVQNPQGSVASGQTYNASEKIGAGYIQFKAFLKKLEIVGGLRAEHTNQGYHMKFPIGEPDPDGKQEYTDFLPSVEFKYMAFDKTNIRLSYFRSINRPGFSEIVPAPVVTDDYTERGDPNLEHAVADNIDLRYEYYPRPAEQFMVGAFYKHIQNPIEYTLQVMGHATYYMPGNFGNATNYGAELDWTRYFNKFGVKANYTYTHSEITTPKAKRIRNASGDLETINVQQTRPLYGQSAHIANLSLLYKDARHGWDAQLSGGYTGPRISSVAQFVDNDQWQKGFVQMDVSVQKEFKRHVTVFAKANNLLNTPMTVVIRNTSSKNANIPNQDMDGETLIRRDYYQRSYVLGVRYKF